MRTDPPRANGDQRADDPLGKETPAWLQGHWTAHVMPDRNEEPYAFLLRAIDELTRRHAQDYVLRDGLSHLILGAGVLLNADWGRLDRGGVSRELAKYAARIDLDLDTETFVD